MALHSDTMVYKASYDLLLIMIPMVEQLPRLHKYTLGERMIESGISLLEHIYYANKQKDKLEYIEHSQSKLEALRLHLRLLFDLKQLSLKRFILVGEKCEEISKQLTAWKHYCKKKMSA